MEGGGGGGGRVDLPKGFSSITFDWDLSYKTKFWLFQLNTKTDKVRNKMKNLAHNCGERMAKIE